MIPVICSMCRNGPLIALSPCRPAGLTSFRLPPSLPPSLHTCKIMSDLQFFLQPRWVKGKCCIERKEIGLAVWEKEKSFLYFKKIVFFLSNVSMSDWRWFIFLFLTIILVKNCVVIFKPTIVRLTDNMVLDNWIPVSGKNPQVWGCWGKFPTCTTGGIGWVKWETWYDGGLYAHLSGWVAGSVGDVWSPRSTDTDW